MLYWAHFCTVTCPTDPAVLKQRELEADGLQRMFLPDFGGIDGGKLPLYCTVCDKYVEDKTKHCATCNRCCYGFDHHCDWLNNCIGKANYNGFRALIGWLAAYITWGMLLVLSMFATGQMMEKDADTGRLKWHAICIYVEIAITVPMMIFVVQLALYHVWLASNGWSTFDHISFKRDL